MKTWKEYLTEANNKNNDLNWDKYFEYVKSEMNKISSLIKVTHIKNNDGEIKIKNRNNERYTDEVADKIEDFYISNNLSVGNMKFYRIDGKLQPRINRDKGITWSDYITIKPKYGDGITKKLNLNGE